MGGELCPEKPPQEITTEQTKGNIFCDNNENVIMRSRVPLWIEFHIRKVRGCGEWRIKGLSILFDQ